MCLGCIDSSERDLTSGLGTSIGKVCFIGRVFGCWYIEVIKAPGMGLAVVDFNDPEFVVNDLDSENRMFFL